MSSNYDEQNYDEKIHSEEYSNWLDTVQLKCWIKGDE